MAYYKDLREFIDELDKRGKVHRFTERINKDTEVMPLARVQLRGLDDADRKVLLFEQVTDAAGGSYDMGLAVGVYGACDEILALGMGCETPREMLEKWHEAEENPIPPRIVDSGPVQEVVIQGEALLEAGLDLIPAPVEEPGFSQMIRTGLPMITRDPTTGITNVGTYNGFFRDRDRIVAGIGTVRETMRVQWQAAMRTGQEMPLAIVIGATPNVMLVGSASLPYGVDEMAVAGGIAGAPVEMVRCKTIPLEVPAHAEAVIEGMVSTELLEPRFGFGEYPGYLNMERNNLPVMRVTAITHRKGALFTPVPVGLPPSDTNAVWGFCNAATLYQKLRYDCRLPVDDVYFPQMGGGNDFCIIRLENNAKPSAPRQVLNVASGLWPGAKYIIAVDNDIDVREPETLIWALSFRVRPESDVSVQAGRHAGLDPSFGATGSSKGKMASSGHVREHYKVLIDATAAGPYPPVALPRREFMERALEIWESQPDLPEPRMRTPWYGYELGFWGAEEQELADLMVAGDYKEVGRRAKKLQVPVVEAPDGPGSAYGGKDTTPEPG